MLQGLEGYNGWLSGSTEQLESTVTAYNKRLIYYIFSITGNPDGAEDLASDVFVRLLMKKPRFRCEEQLSSWLFKTAHNLAEDALRKRKGASVPLDEAPEQPGESEVLDELLQNDRMKTLHAALSELSGDYRSVLTLFYFDGLSYAQIASVLKKNEKQIRNIAYRAKIRLKDQLERMGFEYENR